MNYEHNIVLFISSSDNTLDILRQVIRSFDFCWPDCPFTKFVGLNSIVDETTVFGFQPVYLSVRGWREELLGQILQLPEQYEYILLFLDDFLIFSPVDADRLHRMLNSAMHRELDYLRLVPQKRAVIPAIAKKIFRNAGTDIEPISVHSPYYSSLQVALWKRRHLMKMLESNEGNIWGFEHQMITGHPHFAIVGMPPIQYVHVVEKGKWLPYTPRLFRKFNLPFCAGDRVVQGRLTYLTLWLNRVKFAILGYAIVRLKQYLRA